MPARRKRHPSQHRGPTRKLQARLDDAEATLAAIRSGTVDALVVSGPLGDQTVAIEGATHPYFVLLDAMSDGAVLLDAGGVILFGNKSFAAIAGAPIAALRGSKFQLRVVATERVSFEEFLREVPPPHPTAREFNLRSKRTERTPVAISLTVLPLESPSPVAWPQSRTDSVVMAIITDLTYKHATEAARMALLERLIGAEDDERRRLARELHDETGQSLAALLVGLRAMTDMTSASDVASAALRLRNIAAQTVDDVGRLARGLHPAVLDDMGLAAAGMRYVKDYARSFGCVVDFVATDVDTPRLAPLAAATMYRILQEALTNVARHAAATSVVVELNRDDRTLELQVRDDGAGFDVDRVMPGLQGLGLRGMRERVTLLGGVLSVESQPGRGTVVRANIPSDRAPQKAQRGRVPEETLTRRHRRDPD
jgi:signal transduction histidine kinase